MHRRPGHVKGSAEASSASFTALSPGYWHYPPATLPHRISQPVPGQALRSAALSVGQLETVQGAFGDNGSRLRRHSLSQCDGDLYGSDLRPASRMSCHWAAPVLTVARYAVR
eukprot:766521-Hanusia_phi.AAC.3